MPLIRKDKPASEAPPSQDTAGLAAPDADIRWSAARALAGRPGSSAALGEALAKETDPRVREALFTGLVAAGPEGARAVTPYLRSDDAALRTAAADALRAMGPAVGVVLPALLFEAGDPDVRGLACELVRQAPAAEASALLTRLLDTEAEPNVCTAAIEVLAEIGGPEDAPALSRCAARFPTEPFLGFAARIALDRIAAQRPA